jgi:hypothetical protein
VIYPLTYPAQQLVTKSRKVGDDGGPDFLLSHDVMLLDKMFMAPFSCFFAVPMMSVLNLSRGYRGLVFRVTVPCGRQGHILEVTEHKRTALRFVDSLL